MTGRRFHHTTEVIPRRPWKSKSPFAYGPIKVSKNTYAKGAREVRRGTSSIHFHRTVLGRSEKGWIPQGVSLQ